MAAMVETPSIPSCTGKTKVLPLKVAIDTLAEMDLAKRAALKQDPK
jgi:hypothetical protein